jgi:hypothetical protein
MFSASSPREIHVLFTFHFPFPFQKIRVHIEIIYLIGLKNMILVLRQCFCGT